MHNEVVNNAGIHNDSKFFEPEKQNRIANVHTNILKIVRGKSLPPGLSRFTLWEHLHRRK